MTDQGLAGEKPDHSNEKIGLLIGACLYIAFGIWAAQYTPLLPDEANAGNIARSLYRGEGWSGLSLTHGYHSALGLLPLAPLVSASPSALAVRLPTLLAGAVCPLLIFLILKELGAPRVAGYGAMSVTIHPILFEAHRTGTYISFTVLFGLWSAWKLLAWRRSGSGVDLASSALAAGLALSAKSMAFNWVVAGFLTGGLSTLSMRDARRPTRRQAAAAFGAFLAGSSFFWWSVVWRGWPQLRGLLAVSEQGVRHGDYLHNLAQRLDGLGRILHGGTGYCPAPGGEADPLLWLCFGALGYALLSRMCRDLLWAWLLVALALLASPFTATSLKPYHMIPFIPALAVAVWLTVDRVIAGTPPDTGRNLCGAILAACALYTVWILPSHLVNDRYVERRQRASSHLAMTYDSATLARFLLQRGILAPVVATGADSWAYAVTLRFSNEAIRPVYIWPESAAMSVLNAQVEPSRVFLVPAVGVSGSWRRRWADLADNRGLRRRTLAQFFGTEGTAVLDVVQLQTRRPGSVRN